MNKLIKYISPVIIAVVLAGCGGAGRVKTPGGTVPDPNGIGRASISIKWPEPTRLIPTATKSISVSIRSGERELASRVMNRPESGGTSTATFDSLPTGDVVVYAHAHSSDNGYGDILAEGAAMLRIVDGQESTITITMSSTIERIEFYSHYNLLAKGDTLNLDVFARDKNDYTIMLPQSMLSWTSSNDSVATVDEDGVVTAVGSGHATITVSDRESGKSASTEISVPLNIPVAQRSRWMACNPGTNKVYAAQEYDGGAVSVINGTGSATVITTVPSGSTPTALAIDTASNRIYVVSASSDGGKPGILTVIDGNTDRMIRSIDTITAPVAISVDKLTHRIYVTGRQPTDGIRVINGSTLATITTISLPDGYLLLDSAIMPVHKRLYVMRREGSQTGMTHIIDTTTNTVAGTINTANRDYGTIAADDTRDQLYFLYTGYLQIFNGTGTPIRTKPLGYTYGYMSIAIDPSRYSAYLVSPNGGNLITVDLNQNGSVGHLNGSSRYYYGITVNPLTNRIYVADYWRSTIDMFELGQ